MDEPVIKRRRPSKWRSKNTEPSRAKIYKRVEAKLAGMREPVKCKSCRAWREATEFTARIRAGHLIRKTICKKCESKLAEIAPAPPQENGLTPLDGLYKPQDSTPHRLTDAVNSTHNKRYVQCPSNLDGTHYETSELTSANRSASPSLPSQSQSLAELGGAES
jgi:hypothetical protein